MHKAVNIETPTVLFLHESLNIIPHPTHVGGSIVYLTNTIGNGQTTSDQDIFYCTENCNALVSGS